MAPKYDERGERELYNSTTFRCGWDRIWSPAEAVRVQLISKVVMHICVCVTVLTFEQTWLTGKNAVPVRLNQLGLDDVNNCLACVAWLAHLAQSQ